MKKEIETTSVFIGGIEYAPVTNQNKLAETYEGMPYVIIRTYSAGVHIGYLKKRESTLAGIEVELVNSRRVYKWSGAMTLSCLAMEGTKNPEKCQITQSVNSIELVAIEIIKVSEVGFKSLISVPVWKI